MKCLSAKVLITFFYLASPPAFSQTIRSVDVNQFEIAGVKIGMGYLEASRKLWASFPNSDLIVTLTDNKGDHFSQRLWKMYPESAKIASEAGIVRVWFEPRVPFDRNKRLTVVAVALETPADRLDYIKNAAIMKYGPPSSERENQMQWCKVPLPGGQACKGGGSNPGNRDYLSLEGAVLTLHGNAYSASLRAHFANVKDSGDALYP